MGIAKHTDSELADLEMETKPEDVLAEIERLLWRTHSRKEPTKEPKPKHSYRTKR